VKKTPRVVAKCPDPAHLAGAPFNEYGVRSCATSSTC
jgi:hypothetical protein